MGGTLTLAHTLKRIFRTYGYADSRFSPSLKESDPTYRWAVAANRLDDGRYPVIWTSMTNYALLGAAKYVGRHFAMRPALFLVWFTCSMRRAALVHRTLTALAIYRRAFPEHRFVFLCNEEEERAAFVSAGMDAVVCSQNAFADEAIYRPVPGVARAYDALYNGSMTTQKRRHLARLVPKAAHIFGEVAAFGKTETLALLAEMRRLMPGHDFLNPIDGDAIAKLSRPEVNMALAESATGLCLSQHEGAMFASIEYLLAGLPVVSTPSTGGRHIFGSPETWLTVADTPEAVRDGVSEMKARTVPPDRVRDITLVKIFEHRARLRETVLVHTGGAVDLPAGYGDVLYRSINNWIDGPTMVERIVRI